MAFSERAAASSLVRPVQALALSVNTVVLGDGLAIAATAAEHVLETATASQDAESAALAAAAASLATASSSTDVLVPAPRMYERVQESFSSELPPASPTAEGQDELPLKPQKLRPPSKPGRIAFNIQGAKTAMAAAQAQVQVEVAVAAARARRLNVKDASTQTVRDPEHQDGEIVTIWRLRPRGMESFPHFRREPKKKKARDTLLCAGTIVDEEQEEDDSEVVPLEAAAVAAKEAGQELGEHPKGRKRLRDEVCIPACTDQAAVQIVMDVDADFAAAPSDNGLEDRNPPTEADQGISRATAPVAFVESPENLVDAVAALGVNASRAAAEAAAGPAAAEGAFADADELVDEADDEEGEGDAALAAALAALAEASPEIDGERPSAFEPATNHEAAESVVVKSSSSEVLPPATLLVLGATGAVIHADYSGSADPRQQRR